MPLSIGMMKQDNMTQDKNIRTLAWAGLLCGLTLALTLISIPLPAGYLNLGDVAVLFSAFALPMGWAALAAGVGAALADLILGFALYAPATFVIKGLAALLCALLLKVVRPMKTGLWFIAPLAAAVVIPLGYFGFEYFVFHEAAVADIPWNVLQSGVGVAGAYASALLLKNHLK